MKGGVAKRLAFVLVIVALVSPLAVSAGSKLHSGAESFEDPGSQSALVRTDIEKATGSDPDHVVIALIDRRTSQSLARSIELVAATFRRDPHVARVIVPGRDRPWMMSRTGTSGYALITFKPGSDESVDSAVGRLQAKADRMEAVTLGGPAVAQSQVDETVARDLSRAEAITFPILLLLLFWVFRGLVAAAIPIVGGVLAIILSLAALSAAAELTELSVFALNLVTGLGLGLAIDYGLLIVSRFREELDRDGNVNGAVLRTMRSVGRVVLISSLTVGATTSVLLVFPMPFVYSMGVGGLIVAASSGFVALVVLPAMLLMLGHRVNALAPDRLKRRQTTGRWGSFARGVMKRPAVIATTATVLLVVSALPLAHARFTFGDASVLPSNQSARQVDDRLAREYSARASNPMTLLLRSGRGAHSERASKQIASTPGVVHTSDFQWIGPRLALAEAAVDSRPMSPASESAVARLRSVSPDLAVGGLTAHLVDLKHSVRANLPLALLIVCMIVLIAILLLTGSLVMAVKTLVINTLSIGATLGIVVVVFQDLLGEGAIGTAEPIVLSVLALGLATDYGAFLLGRVREERDGGADDREAIALGLERTGGIVTAAAVLFCVAMSAFLLSSNVYVQQLGFGIAVGVLLDAFVVRTLLVPSVMCLLGGWNWWSPRPLRFLQTREAQS